MGPPPRSCARLSECGLPHTAGTAALDHPSPGRTSTGLVLGLHVLWRTVNGLREGGQARKLTA
jgi:hypothetical protein